MEVAEGFDELDGFGFLLKDFVSAAAARDDQDIVVLEIFVGVFVVDVRFNCETGGGGYAGGGGGDGAFEGFAFWGCGMSAIDRGKLVDYEQIQAYVK